MWSRTIIKSNAKAALRGKFWIAFAVVLTVSILPNMMSIITTYFDPNPSTSYTSASDFNYALGGLLGWAFLFLCIFVVIPLTIGKNRFFVQNRFGHTQYDNVFSGFRHGYGSSVLTSFVTYLLIGLWSLLLFVPGIIKALEYSMVPFILSDNPNIDGSRARQISRMMTDGEKSNIFVLYLSFLGWCLIPFVADVAVAHFSPVLGIALFCIGMFFVESYISATFAELYVFLRDRAIQSGMVHPAELNLMPPQEQYPQQPQM